MFVRIALVLSCGVFLAIGDAGASQSQALSMHEARAKAQMTAQAYFGDLFDSKARVSTCVRRSRSKVSCAVQIGRPGGYMNCRFRIYVGRTKTSFILRARELACD